MKRLVFYFFKLRILFLLFSLVMVTESTAFAVETTMSVAQKYYYGHGTPKNLRKAFNLYLKAAKKGNVDAMFIVGGMYMKGMGVKTDTGEAFKWLYNAAINGKSSKESERILAQFFITGQNVPQNYDEAMHWYELAAKRGDPDAQSELGYLYFTGKLSEKDYEKAGYWFEKAARKGYALAQYNMGILWYTGNGVPTVDMIKAYSWFSVAATNGHGSAVAATNFLNTILSSNELQEAQNVSVKLYKEINNLK